jgi:hypothetical protein
MRTAGRRHSTPCRRRNAAAPFPRRPAPGERTRESVAGDVRLTVMIVAAGYLIARGHGLAGTAAAGVVLVLTVRMVALAQVDRQLEQRSTTADA